MAILAALDRAIATDTGTMGLRLAELARLLLPAWQLELDRLTSSEVRQPQAVSCRIGCSACCRHPVPVSIPEAFMLADVVADLPESSRLRVLGARDFAVAGLRVGGLAAAPLLSRARDYMKLDLPCPFLDATACSIHPQRPAACREHLVTSPPDLCRTLDGGALPVSFPWRLSEVLAAVAARLIGGAPTQIPLIHALDWCAENAEIGRRTWHLATLRQVLADLL